MHLSMILGGGKSWTAKYFEELGEKLKRLKTKYEFKVVVGGVGAWQLERETPDWVDIVFIGHAEIDFPEIIKKIEDIPPIINPARGGEVQITRGCPRGC